MKEKDITESRFSIPNFNKKNEENIPKKKESENNDSQKNLIDSIEKKGFYCVINHPENPKEAFKKLVNNHEENRNEVWEEIRKGHEYKIQQYKDQITFLKENLNQESENFNTHSKETKEEKEKQLNEVRIEINKIESEIQNLSEDVASKKANGIEERIKKVREELKGLVTTLEEITDRRDKINDDNYDRDKDFLKKNVDFWDTLSKKYEATLTALEGKTLVLFKNGITPRVAHFFTFTGVSATILAGWLFAIFSSIRNIDDEDWLFFIFESLYCFGNDIQYRNNLLDWQWIIFCLVSFLALLTLITLIGWICKMLFYRWVEQKKKGKSYQNKNHESFIEESEEISPKFLKMWLQWVPYIFIGAVIYVIIQLGTDLTKLKALDVSLTGQAVGSGLALIIGGLGFAYITNIIMPRFKNDETDILPSNPWKKGLRFLGKSSELVILLLIFLITFIIMYINKENGAGAIIGFVAVSLISGYLLGLGLRFKGLLDTKRYLENRFVRFKIRANRWGSPLRSNLDWKEDNLFTQGFLALEKELLDLLILKTIEINPKKQTSDERKYSILLEKEDTLSSDVNNKKKKRSIFMPVRRMINKLRKPKEEDIESNVYIHVTEHEKTMFPVETQKIQFFEEKRKNKKKEEKNIVTYLENFNEEKSDYQIVIKTLKSDTQERINECKDKISKELENYVGQLKVHKNENIVYEIALQEGYDLGHWYLKYGTKDGFKK